MIRAYRFRSKRSSDAIILIPNSEEQHSATMGMLRMWMLNNLENCGIVFAEEFARQHGIRYVIEVKV